MYIHLVYEFFPFTASSIVKEQTTNKVRSVRPWQLFKIRPRLIFQFKFVFLTICIPCLDHITIIDRHKVFRRGLLLWIAVLLWQKIFSTGFNFVTWFEGIKKILLHIGEQAINYGGPGSRTWRLFEVTFEVPLTWVPQATIFINII